MIQSDRFIILPPVIINGFYPCKVKVPAVPMGHITLKPSLIVTSDIIQMVYYVFTPVPVIHSNANL